MVTILYAFGGMTLFLPLGWNDAVAGTGQS